MTALGAKAPAMRTRCILVHGRGWRGVRYLIAFALNRVEIALSLPWQRALAFPALFHRPPHRPSP